MGKYIGPRRKYERRFGLIPGEAPKPRRLSNYGIILEEKQKLKFIYGIRENQLARLLKEARKLQGPLGDNLLSRVETRLDNIVYRLGYAKTRRQARQLVNHRHILVDNKKVNIPSYQVEPGQSVSLNKTIKDTSLIKEALEEKGELPSWISMTEEGQAKITSLPQDYDLPKNIDMQAVIAFYSR